jgi:regulatory protein
MVIEELAEAGYIDDARYAQRFAEEKRALAGWGAERIENELERRGVPSAVIARTLAAWSAEDELHAASALLTERYGEGFDGERQRGRAYGFLLRRGYGPELAEDAVLAHVRSGSQ